MAEEIEQAVPSGRKKKTTIIAVAVVVLMSAGVASFLMLGAGDEPAGVVGTEKKTQESVYIDLKPEFVINFRDRNDRPKFLKAEMSVATTDSDIEEAVARHMPAIRNNIVLLLSRQIYDDLIPNEGKERLRMQALAEVQSVLKSQIGKPGVDQLYFSSFVMH